MPKFLVETKCPMCGKKFIAAPMLVYKDGHKKFCSYTCFNAYLKAKENKRKTKRPISPTRGR